MKNIISLTNNPFTMNSQKNGAKAVAEPTTTDCTVVTLEDDNCSADADVDADAGSRRSSLQGGDEHDHDGHEQKPTPSISTRGRPQHSSSGEPEQAPEVPAGNHGKRSAMKQPGSARREAIQARRELQLTILGHEDSLVRKIFIEFNEAVRVKRVPPVYELTDDLNSLWFQDEEYETIRTKCFSVADKHLNGEMPEGQKLCIRGLEPVFNYEIRQETKELAWDSVLTEQAYQRDSFSYDDEYLREGYSAVAENSLEEAILRAKQDEKEVQKYLRSTRRFCDRLRIALESLKPTHSEHS